MYIQIVLGFVLALFVSQGDVVSSARTNDPPDHNVKQSAPQMERLNKALAGEWLAEETYDTSELLPAGGKGRSTESYRVGPAGMSLIEEYHGDGPTGKSWGTGIIWWDSETAGFHFVWCDSYTLDRGCRASSQAGRWEGDSYIQTDVHEVSGKKVFEKEIWSGFTQNSYVQTLYVGDAADNLKRFVTIRAERSIHQ